jgi:hypothetical protein
MSDDREIASLLRDLFTEVYYLNDRIVQGDIVSPGKAIPAATKLCNSYTEVIGRISECESISLKPYIAAGGVLGIFWSYEVNLSDEHRSYAGSTVPRRMPS